MTKLALGRTCGGCTSCCKTHGVAEVDHIGGEWCKHCDVGSGCSIYARRPKPCEVYECCWLKGEGEEDDRPDQSQFVMDVVQIPAYDIVTVRMFREVNTRATELPRVQELKKLSLDAGEVVQFIYASPAPGTELFTPNSMGMVEQMLFKLAFAQWSEQWAKRS